MNQPRRSKPTPALATIAILVAACAFRPSGAAQESNLPTHGLHAPAGFEDGADLALLAVCRAVGDHPSDHAPPATEARGLSSNFSRERLSECRILARSRGLETRL
jgi:hypothetical protein